MNHLINLKLTALEGAGIVKLNNGKENIECLVLPLAANNLNQTANGDIYLNLVAWSSDKLKDGKTHLLKQSLLKEVREKMPKDQLTNMPILGDMKPMEEGGAVKPMVAYTVSAPTTPSAPAADDEDIPEWMR